MTELHIKTKLTKLIEKIIISENPNLSIRSVLSPSERLHNGIRYFDDFEILLNSSEVLTFAQYRKISNEICLLFKGASFDSYKDKGRKHYFISTFIKIIPTGELMSVNSCLP